MIMMNTQEIKNTVRNALENSSECYLEQVVSSGIHNLTNDFHGETDEEYEEFASEFQEQAAEMLEKINNA